MRLHERKSYEKYIENKINRLLIKKVMPSQKSGVGIVFECICECGNITFPKARSVIKNKTKSCGCIRKNHCGSPILIHKHIGEKHNYLKIIDVKYHKSLWECICLCDCGKQTRVRYNNLVNESTISCGCSKIPTLKKKQEMFLRFVEKKEICWIWKGRINDLDGRYGTYHGKRAHRVSYKLFVGPIGKGQHVLHRCDLPLCVSPNCLFLGSAKDNSEDMVSKDRHCRGERSPRAKLSKKDVLFIKKELFCGVYGTVLAKQFNVNNSTIYAIKNGTRWKHLVKN